MKYLHSKEMHNLQSPRIVVPLIVEDIKPQSVVDFGCGLGTWISEFKRSGVQDVLGLDGAWVDKTNFEPDVLHNFMVADLESPIRLDRKFDLAISLEVAEHLDKKSARSFVASLTMASDVVLFSAAIPGQGGQNHINEQPLTYWKQLFEEHGYLMYDTLRGKLWDEQGVYLWYKQNMVYFSKRTLNFAPTVLPVDIVHPELLKIARGGAPTLKTILLNICTYVKLKLGIVN